MLFNQFTNMKKISGLSVALALTLASGFSSAGALNLADEPLYLGGAIDPNIVFMLDDSGSMHWEVMPDSIRNMGPEFTYPTLVDAGSSDPRVGLSAGDNHTRIYNDTNDYDFDTVSFVDGEPMTSFSRSARNNKIYYNPAITYKPWSNADGSLYPNASTTCAPHNPERASRGCRNLTITNEQEADWYDDPNTLINNTDRTFWPAVYYNWTNASSDDDVWNTANYTRVEIRSTTLSYSDTALDEDGNTLDRSGRTDCASAPTCSYAEEIQNFANWYTYYRSRILLARAGIGKAFSEQSTKMRVGFGAINEGSNSIDGQTSARAMIKGVRKFESTERSAWFDLLYEHQIPRSGTPLRTALQAAGEYYTRTDDNGPWSETPGTVSTNPHLTCRQSYTVLMSDGYWNGGSPHVGDSDSTAGSSITNDISASPPSYTYTPGPPYEDTDSDTLADVAMEYWKTDLRPLLDNQVPPNLEDPAFWQHMVTYTVGLGVVGTLDPTATQTAIDDGTDPSWPDQPNSEDERRIDDMWHAAVNSRGAFFSASDPQTFATSLSQILLNLTSRTSSAASVALNSSSFVTDSTVYQARFDTGNWTGQLLANSVSKDSNGDLVFSLDWDASDGILTSHTLRKIVTYDGTQGQPFRWSNLTTAQQTALGTENLTNYIRGDDTYEGSLYRNRVKLLGDIINSSPAFVGAPSERYPDYWGAGAPENASASLYYSKFRADNFSRDETIYFGANDGMLHAFNASQNALVWGTETGAFVPNTVISKLPNLAATPYIHEYFVDGSPEIKDAFFGSAWHSVLISGLGSGGQGIFALDVTDPPDAADTESSLAAKVLWEFGDSATPSADGYSDGDRELGYTFGRPNIARLKHDGGKWVAIFGNGYNSTYDDDGDGANNDSSTGDAYLFIVDLQTGTLVRRISTQTGVAEDPTVSARPNGLSNVTPIDANGDSITDYVFAGDLFGNLWKFDLTDDDEANWDVAYKDSSSNPIPVFTALSDQADPSTAQPITSRVTVASHPLGYGGFMIYFGTGKYLEPGDNERAGQETQTLYGIWDRNMDTDNDGVKDLVVFNRNDLLTQEILGEATTSAGNFRIISDYDILYHTNENLVALYAPSSPPGNADTSTPSSLSTSTHLGWYMDLVDTSVSPLDNKGEKIVSDPLIRVNRIIVNTLIPSRDACDFGGESWGMEPDIINGGRLDDVTFDVNSDNSFGLQDYVGLDANGNYVSIDADGDGVIDSGFDADGDGIPDSPSDIVAVSGKKIESGIAATPTMLRDNEDDKDFKIDSTSQGILEVLKSPDALEKGRQSWIELFR